MPPAPRYEVDDADAPSARPRHPADPRQQPNYRPRGPRTFRYGYAEIAALAGVTPGAIKKAKQRRRLDPADLASVMAYVGRTRRRREVVLSRPHK